MNRVSIRPEMLRWARRRSGKDLDELTHRFPRLQLWEKGESFPTLKQLESFAKATYTPVGFLFLDEPPPERIPIPDFRTVGGRIVAQPSPNLLETIYLCQQRQAWYREFARSIGQKPLPFVGSAGLDDPVETTAEKMRQALHFDLDARRDCPTWTEALREFIRQADALGVLVMVSGVYLNNTHRKLDPQEFRGIAMADDLAPLVFINGADSKAAQMFTLAHELAHIWLGQSALSDSDPSVASGSDVEVWCNHVAAELLAPLEVVAEELRPGQPLETEAQRLARRFKVSSLVMLRRIYDTGRVPYTQFQRAYDAELERLKKQPKGSGGDFYLTQAARVSKRFARALVASTLEGQTLYRDALQMLGISKVKTFQKLGRSLGYST